MDDVVGILKLYGDVREELARTQEREKILTEEKQNLEKKIEEVNRNYKALEIDNANLLQWNTDMRNSIMRFCALHQMRVDLPAQPRLNITNNFNGKMLNYGTLGGDMNDATYDDCNEDDSGNTPTEQQVKKAVESIDAEGTLTEDRQWFAIYKVLTQYCGYPTNMSLFCKNIAALQMTPLNHPCVYDNWRRVGHSVPHLPQNVDLWPNNKEEHSQLESDLTRVSQRFIALLATSD